MKILATVGALALTFGIASAGPAVAQVYYDRDLGYMKRGYVDDDFDRASLMTRSEVVREVEDQGFDVVSDLRVNSFGGNWQATARDDDGELVTIVIDPFTGRVLSEDEI